jgi:hypothetical protein
VDVRVCVVSSLDITTRLARRRITGLEHRNRRTVRLETLLPHPVHSIR